MNRAATEHQAKLRQGYLFGIAAYGLWGVLPIYFKMLTGVPSADIVVHRILWSLPLLAILLSLTGHWHQVRGAILDRRTLRLLTVTALLIAANWLLYVYAVNSGRLLAGSLGYYLNPLANVLLGRLILKERLNRLQWVAVAIAAAGIAPLALQAFDQLWISLTLCLSFATYGLLRKVATVDAVAGLAIETSLLLPFALAWLAWGLAAGAPAFGTSARETVLLLLAGLVSTAPLLLFTGAARRLPYSTLGMLQFLAPTLQFAIAVGLYGETFTPAHGMAFGAIWAALAVYVAAIVRNSRAAVTLPE
ncbi:MAG TPA: EamA family transporter RarD [Sphingomicrobium sp.]|nr:EamA family transporter RarD [Sphingomicrobium sp.]